MRLFQDKFSIYKKAGEPFYKTPKSVQECIEILKIAPDGIFEVAGNRYSKSYLFSDVNYNTISEAERECYNSIMEKKIMEGKQGTLQERYLTVSIIRKNYEEAKAC